MLKKNFEFADGFRPGSVPSLIGAHFINEIHSTRHARLLHMHKDQLELFFVCSGEGEYIVNGCTYHVQKGDLVICNAGILHGEEPSRQRRLRSYSIALTDVRVKGLPDNFLTAEKENPVIKCGAYAKQLSQMMQLLYSLYLDPRPMEQVCSHLALSILFLSYNLIKHQYSKRNIFSNAGLLASQIKRYLDEHYSEALTLSSISRELNLSEYYLAHIFKNEMGLPPMQYVMKRRMGEAQTLLMDTDMPIAEISEQIGYKDPWNFSTAFRKCVGLSPSQYRKSFHEMEKKQ